MDAFPRFARAFSGGAINAGTAYYVEGFSGVALWLPSGTLPNEASLLCVIEDTAAEERQDAMFSMFERMEGYHPRVQHWHLPLIGVNPVSQGRGYGDVPFSHQWVSLSTTQLSIPLVATRGRHG
jgi:hypothetical protein